MHGGNVCRCSPWKAGNASTSVRQNVLYNWWEWCSKLTKPWFKKQFDYYFLSSIVFHHNFFFIGCTYCVLNPFHTHVHYHLGCLVTLKNDTPVKGFVTEAWYVHACCKSGQALPGCAQSAVTASSALCSHLVACLKSHKTQAIILPRDKSS